MKKIGFFFLVIWTFVGGLFWHVLIKQKEEKRRIEKSRISPFYFVVAVALEFQIFLENNMNYRN